MKTLYVPSLGAQLTIDDRDRVRHVLQTQHYYASEQPNARLAAAEYLRSRAKTFAIPPAQLERLHLPASFLDPRKQGIEYRHYDTKKFFASATFCYYQTIDNVPVWRAGATVTVKDNPLRVVHADNYGHHDLEVELPAPELIERWRALLMHVDTNTPSWRRLRKLGAAYLPKAERGVPLVNVLAASTGETPNARTGKGPASWVDAARVTRGLFYVYRYDADDRVPARAFDITREGHRTADLEQEDAEPTLPLPAVPKEIRDGRHYLVAELIFHLPQKHALNWRALVDVATGSILWLRAMTSGVNGLVFTYDPQTSTGDLTMTPDDGNAILNPLRDDVVLTNLDAPVGGEQSLSGTHVRVADDDSPPVAPPKEPVGDDFDYDARTDEFAAVNAYYHANNLFDTIEDLGFPLATYFDGTSFPVHLDHRASTSAAAGATGIEQNAFCNGDGPGGMSGDGIGMVGFCLSDLTDTTHPLGRAVDKWVHWHEVGGHGILWDHVNSPNFGFAHSAGDALAAFQNDPESHLRALPERFRYAPFRGLDRWFNRTVASGWGWGGTQDLGGYESEQILATTLFRMYRALGGDATEVPKRWHASRVATYLVLNAVGKLSPGTNPPSAEGFYNKLIDADADDWTSEGLVGGAYGKVIRWAFEKQGLWRAPGAPTTDIGAPPPVDLYIDDGRGGEYDYQPVHWECASVWNRAAADGGLSHEPGMAGVQSYVYVRVRNRGTTDASGTVKVYHCEPGAGLTWPTDFVQAGPAAGLPTGALLANDGNDTIVGPFAWTPNVNAYGHDCLLAIVSAEGDASNVDKLVAGETIEEWRLVPHDNNIGQRNVALVPGGGGGEALSAALDGMRFFAGNPSRKSAQMHVRIDVPRVLAAKGWRLVADGIDDAGFRLKAGERREIRLRLAHFTDFAPDDLRQASERDFRVRLYRDGMLAGGMTYRVDPALTTLPHRAFPEPGCAGAAQDLVDCLRVSGGRKVRKVRVKKVEVDIEFADDHDCD